MLSARPVIVAFAAIFIAAVATLVVVILLRKPTHDAPDFTLTDQFGRPFSLSAQRGHAVVVYFGYAHCPDECPLTLANEESAIRTLGAGGKDVEIAFVTVDPARDNQSALGRYAKEFGTNVFGLSGTPNELDRAYAGYHIYHKTLPPKRGTTDYAVDHSSAVFYISKSGTLAAYGDSSDSRSAVIEQLQKATE